MTPTDLQNLPDQKSYDIFNLIELEMISMYLKSEQSWDMILVSLFGAQPVFHERNLYICIYVDAYN